VSNGYYVAWGVWDAEHRALTARVDLLEEAAARDAENRGEGERERRDRTWMAGLALATGIIFPIVVSSVIMYLHLRAYH
jgi:hypothetical protein